MQDTNNLINKLTEDQEYLKNMQISLYENLNILMENQKNKLDNQDLVVQNQSLIIKNQDTIVNNQINIIRNQHQIVENQVTLAVILKTQAKILFLVEKLAGNDTNEKQVHESIQEIFAKKKSEFDHGVLKTLNFDI